MIDLMAKAAEMNILTNQGKAWPSEKSLLKYLYENMAAASIASLLGISISAVMHKLKKHVDPGHTPRSAPRRDIGRARSSGTGSKGTAQAQAG